MKPNERTGYQEHLQYVLMFSEKRVRKFTVRTGAELKQSREIRVCSSLESVKSQKPLQCIFRRTRTISVDSLR